MRLDYYNSLARSGYQALFIMFYRLFMKGMSVDQSNLLAAIGVAIAAIAEGESSSDDEPPKKRPMTPRKLPKSRGYFALIERMDDDEFFSHFRLRKGKML